MEAAKRMSWIMSANSADTSQGFSSSCSRINRISALFAGQGRISTLRSVKRVSFPLAEGERDV